MKISTKRKAVSATDLKGPVAIDSRNRREDDR